MSQGNTGSTLSENLELRAIEQRHRMHETVEELRRKVAAGRERLNVTNMLQEHFNAVAATTSILGLAIGFNAGGVFKRSQDGKGRSRSKIRFER